MLGKYIFNSSLLNFREEILHLRIDFLKLLISDFVLGDQFRFGLDRGCHCTQLITAGPYIGIFTAGHDSQHRAAHTGPLLGHRAFQFAVQHIGEDPLPQVNTPGTVEHADRTRCAR